jgi:ribonuclease HI
MSNKIYAVKVGRETGLFYSWPECQASVMSYPGAIFKGFTSKTDAEAFLGEPKKEAKADFILDLIEHAEDPEGNEMIIYVDGSYKDGRYSWSLTGPGIAEEPGVTYGVGTHADAAEMRNVAGELAAAMRAAVYAEKHGKIAVIYHDYQGISSWVKSEWKAKNDMTKAYVEFMKKHPKTKFVKVAGHTGNKYNEEADRLAKLALGIK